MMSSSSALRLLCGAFALSGCWAGWPSSRIIGSDACARDACGAAFDAAELREGSGPRCSDGCYPSGCSEYGCYDDGPAEGGPYPNVANGNCTSLSDGTVDATCTFYEAVPQSPSTQADIDALYQACCACTFAESRKDGCAPMPGFIAEGGNVTECDDDAEAEILNGCRTTSTCSDSAATCFYEDAELECDWAAVSTNEGGVCQEIASNWADPAVWDGPRTMSLNCVDPSHPASCDALGNPNGTVMPYHTPDSEGPVVPVATIALNDTHHLAWDGDVVEYVNETHHIW